MVDGLGRTGVLLSADGLQLVYREWLADAPRATLVIVHGLGEHAGRYAHLAMRLNALGFNVRAHDQRGHGRSQGARGALAHSEDLVADLKLVVDDFSRQQDSVPFLLGHSMGGLVAARFATLQLSPLRGLVLSSPALAFHLSAAQRVLLAAASVLAPSLKAPNKLDVRGLSHDATVIAAYQSDALVHDIATPRLVRFMQDAGASVLRDAFRIAVPVLLQVAGQDRLVDCEGSRVWFARLSPGVGTMHWYDDAYHEIYNESVERRARVLADLSAWLGAQLAKTTC
jgi:alpha-beta hydrolase superfamily lysophospholipase